MPKAKLEESSSFESEGLDHLTKLAQVVLMHIYTIFMSATY